MIKFKSMTTVLGLLVSSYAAAHSLYPDLVTTRSELSNRSIDTTTMPGKVLLRFSNGVANIGQGRLEIRGGNVVNGQREVFQRIFTTHSTYVSRFAGYMIYHPTHSHVHFKDFASYKIRRIVGATGVGEIVASSQKVSFCLEDSAVYNSSLANFRWFRRYSTCGSTVQGISVGWKDVYHKSLPDQWVDVSNLSSGRYWLESSVDPTGLISESNETNNTTRVQFDLVMPVSDRMEEGGEEVDLVVD